MQNVDPTRALYAKAHELGDEYYRCVSRSLHTRGVMDDDCEPAAAAYLVALKGLIGHLRSLKQTSDVRRLVVATRSYIDIVNKDIDQFAVKKPLPLERVSRVGDIFGFRLC